MRKTIHATMRKLMMAEMNAPKSMTVSSLTGICSPPTPAPPPVMRVMNGWMMLPTSELTIAVKAQKSIDEAASLACKAKRGSDEWRAWRQGEGWKKWEKAAAPALAARRRALSMLGSREAVLLLFNVIAPRFVGRPGGYTRIMTLAKPRLGDAGKRAIIEFVGKNDRPKRKAIVPTVE